MTDANNQTQNYDQNDEIDLLDLLVTIAESWILLLVVPLLVGIATFFFITLQPSNEFSKASVTLDISEAAVKHLSDPRFFGEIMQADKFKNIYVDQAELTKQGFLSSVTTAKVADDFTRIDLQHSNSETAKSLLELIIDELEKLSLLDPDRLLLEQKIEIYQDGLNRLISTNESFIQRSKNLPISIADTELSIEITNSIASLSDRIISNRLTIADLEKALENFPNASIVEPIKVTTIVKQKNWMLPVILAVLGTGFLLLIFVFVRAGFRSASKDPESKEKIQRIQKAFGFGNSDAK